MTPEELDIGWEPDAEELPFERRGDYVHVELSELKNHGIVQVRNG